MLLSSKITTVFPKVRKHDGLLGIEIEAEFKNTLEGRIGGYWAIKGDGSLRGNGYEFVLNRPIAIKELTEALNIWNVYLLKEKAKYIHSNRCSIHIHNNVQPFTVLQTLTAISTYWLLEPYLMGLCGEERKGNNFCLTLQDADGIHTRLVKNIKTNKFFEDFDHDHFRYASLNLEALPKFGSLEVRTMKGTNRSDLIADWATINYEVFQNSKKFTDPSDLMEQYYNRGPNFIAETILSQKSINTLNTANKGKDLTHLLEQNALYISEIADARKDWDANKDKDEKKEIQKKVYELKHKQLISLGFEDNDDLKEAIHHMVKRELISNNGFTNEDFED